MSGAIRLLPVILCWGMAAFSVVQGGERDKRVAQLLAAGFAAGLAAGLALVTADEAAAFAAGKGAVALCFAALFAAAPIIAWRGMRFERLVQPLPTFACRAAATATGLVFGYLCLLRLPVYHLPAAAPLAALALVPFLAVAAGRRLPGGGLFSGSGLSLLLVSLLLLASSFMLRLDIFTPLSMKVMKFLHDFVHQFFESMLIPDHLFFREEAWNYIGFLFGNEVGFWGALAIWLLPPVLVILATARASLPSVAAVRQGAKRRRELARYLRERRRRLVVPACSLLLLCGAVYRSANPSVEYWDPKPIPVSESLSGDIVIPLTGEGYDLGDGRIHKFVVRDSGTDIRFMVLRNERGLTVTLDACSICQPEGYGQAEGSVVCYYCMTLIPVETVGSPGGCNPVPVPSTAVGEGVAVSRRAVVNLWRQTVQATKPVPAGGGS